MDIDKYPARAGPAVAAFDNGADTPARDDGARIASFLHEIGKLRRLYVDAEAFANPGWDIMLTLYLGEHDGVAVGRASLAAGNQLDENRCNAVLGELAKRGLVRLPDGDVGASGRHVSLTDYGRQRMQAFLRSATRI